MNASGQIELSVVMPCLNEADTLEVCIQKAQAGIAACGVSAEIVVADNGSTDGSQAIARTQGARVVDVPEPGYGSAMMGGIEASQGRFILMGDADDSYDFGEIPRFVEKLRQGYDLVQGCRLSSGGGKVMPGAMPALHRWWGNPMFSFLARRWFKSPVHDVYCGMRGFSRSLYNRLDQRCVGMEFATEMIIKSSLYGEKIAEVPITLHRDGRKSHPPHLKTFRDGWRTLRFFLMFSPRWLFLIPGLLLIGIGLVGYGLALPGVRIHGITFDAHTLLFATVAILCGYQTILFAIFTKTFAINERLLPEDARLNWFFKHMYLERGLILGMVTMIGGAALLFLAVLEWKNANFGRLDYAHTMRIVVPGATLSAVGFQTILSSFFVSILGLQRR